MNTLRGMTDVKLTIEQVNELNELIERATPLAVIADKEEPEKWGFCPKCRCLINRNSDNFCRKCGQKVDTENAEF